MENQRRKSAPLSRGDSYSGSVAKMEFSNCCCA